MKVLRIIAIITFVQVLSGIAGNTVAWGQEPHKFQKDINNFKPAMEVSSENLTVFAGSSTFTKWKDIQESFPGKNVLNNGFGGSQTSDLIYFAEEAILRYKPSTVVVYEGDNDLSGGKLPEEVIKGTRKLISIIHETLPETKLIIVSPKPSMSRFNAGMKDEFMAYNALLKKMVKKYKYVKFVSIWKEMLGKDGNPKEEYYLEDKLHLSKEGYKIWTKKLKKYVR